MNRTYSFSLLLFSVLIGTIPVLADDIAIVGKESDDDQNQKIVVEDVISGLQHPTSVVIQPETGHVFVADSGAQRIVRIVDKKLEEVITDFPISEEGACHFGDGNPLSLLFIDQETLLVGTGGSAAGKDTISVYKVPAVGADPIKAGNDADQKDTDENDEGAKDEQGTDKKSKKSETKKAETKKPKAEKGADDNADQESDETAGEESGESEIDSKSLPKTDEAAAEGDFYGMAKTGRGVFVTCQGDQQKGWVALAELEDGKLKAFKRSIATTETTKCVAPSAITYSPDGYLLIGQMGATGDQKDSLLVFADVDEGKVLKSFKAGLTDVTGLAYGPIASRLFATEYNLENGAHGALVKLVGKGDQCERREVMPLERPTSLAFSPEGDLYVALAGKSLQGKSAEGKIIVIKGLDIAPETKQE